MLTFIKNWLNHLFGREVKPETMTIVVFMSNGNTIRLRDVETFRYTIGENGRMTSYEVEFYGNAPKMFICPVAIDGFMEVAD